MIALADLAFLGIVCIAGILVYRRLFRSPKFRSLVDDISPADEGEEALDRLKRAGVEADCTAQDLSRRAARETELAKSIREARGRN